MVQVQACIALALRGVCRYNSQNKCSGFQQERGMSLDFQQVQEQVRQLGEQARQRQELLLNQRDRAMGLLNEFANEQETLREKVRQVAAHYDPGLRCAAPPDPEVAVQEALNAAPPLPPLPAQATILAADGSQIA